MSCRKIYELNIGHEATNNNISKQNIYKLVVIRVYELNIGHEATNNNISKPNIYKLNIGHEAANNKTCDAGKHTS